jgi:hypothetical protein
MHGDTQEKIVNKKQRPTNQDGPRQDEPLAYDEALAGQEMDGGESTISGRSRERHVPVEDLETPRSEQDEKQAERWRRHTESTHDESSAKEES